ncbi:MAG TPA: VWA domain-containing protein [Myxococcota bacterium]|nr:VWA domain-containing protein [Myxococcota bacterium]
MRRRPVLLALGLVLSIGAAPRADAGSAQPSVARPTYVVDGETKSHSTVFFIPAPEDEVGVVAVGAAHSFDLAKLGRAGEVRFMRPASKTRVSVSSRYLVKPGTPFRAKGGSLRSDFVVFALDIAPVGVDVLEPARGRLRTGTRVRLLGVPNAIAQDEDDLYGSVVEVGDDRIEVDLDVAGDLRGWGGAPVLVAETGQVIGILEGAWPIGGTYRVGVAPLGGVLDALKKPLAKGLGQPFSFYEAYAWDLPKPVGNPFGEEEEEPDPLPNAPKVARTVPPTPPGTRRPPPPSKPPRVARQDGEPATLSVEIEYPEPGAVVGNRSGGFLAGYARADVDNVQRFDVVFVIDTSGSTVEPTGQDVNGNGVVGKAPLGAVGSIFGLGSSDPGDSILSAEVLAARQMLQGLDPRSTRVGLVSFAGLPADAPGMFRRRAPHAAVTEEPLTTDYGRIEDALMRIFQRGPDGMTHMAAGIDQATIELLGLRGALSQTDADAEKLVLFFTDGQPTLPYESMEKPNIEAVFRAAERARRGGIKIHSFALGPDALEGPIATVEMAARTHGYFTPVRDPGDLIQVVEVVRFTEIETVRVHNLTNDQDADHVQLNADGSWTALVPLEVGHNDIEIVAVADDGRTATEKIVLQHAPGEADPVVPRELIAQRNRLLERKLLELRRGRIAQERAAAEQARKELQIEIQRERAKAAEQAERQRKELDIEVGTDGDG